MHAKQVLRRTKKTAVRGFTPTIVNKMYKPNLRPQSAARVILSPKNSSLNIGGSKIPDVKKSVVKNSAIINARYRKRGVFSPKPVPISQMYNPSIMPAASKAPPSRGDVVDRMYAGRLKVVGVEGVSGASGVIEDPLVNFFKSILAFFGVKS